ncbi:MAG: histidine kinase [Porticoccaceae bacterium]|nr:histidine kinase [Porticoccaceae bacterium]
MKVSLHDRWLIRTTHRALCCRIAGVALLLLLALWGFLFAATRGNEQEIRRVLTGELATMAAVEESVNLMARRHYAFGALVSLFVLVCAGWLYALCKRQRVVENRLHALQREHLKRADSDGESRIAREIHDDLGQKLTVMRMDIAMLVRTVQNEPAAQLVEALDDLKNQVDGAIGSVRAIVDHRAPPELAAGFVPAVKQLVAVFRDSFSILIHFNCYLSDDFALEKGIETTAFRVIQESLANVIHHARASEVTLDLGIQNNNLIVRIEDDGIGFPKGDTRTVLRSLRERIATARGWIYISNMHSGGACVEVSLPLRSGNPHLSTRHEALT